MTKHFTQLYKRHLFVWSSALFVALSLIAATLNYAYYPVIAHILSPSNFGAAQVLIALLLQVGSIFSGLNLVVIFLVQKLSPEKSRQAIETLQKLTISFFAALIVIVILGQNVLLRFLHLDKRLYLFIVALDLLTVIPFILAYGNLQAHKRFFAAGSLQITMVGTKLVLGFAATSRWGVVGALLGFSLGQVFGVALYWLVSKLLRIAVWDHSILYALTPPRRQELAQLRPLAGSIGSIFVVNVLLVLFISFDIISARHYFGTLTSGLYAGASTLSNAIIFVCVPLIGVLLPHLHTGQLRLSRKVLFRTSGMVLSCGLFGTAVFALFPRPLLSIFGSQYTSFAYLLWRLGVLMALLSLITLLLQVSAFYRSKQTALICLAALGGLIALVMSHHQSPRAMVSALTWGFAIIVVISLVQIWQVYGYKQD